MSPLSGLSVHLLNATPLPRRSRSYAWMIPGNLVGIAILIAILWRAL